MKVIHFNKAESYEPEKDWKRVSLCNEKDISIEHFTKPPKHASPSHEHPSSQVLIVIKGKLSVVTEKDGEEVCSHGSCGLVATTNIVLAVEVRKSAHEKVSNKEGQKGLGSVFWPHPTQL